jgi:cytochrome c biogenesis protein CcmG, thiol:disulfide interchange protein DsbE
MVMKRALPWIVGVVFLTAVLIVGLSQAGGDDAEQGARPAAPFDLEAARERLEGAPAPLSALHEQSAELLEGGVPAFERRLETLKGTPVVINKWASWCGPCRSEFPVFQRVATERGKEIAFLGLNSGDSTRPARDFLALYPIPFPSYVDPDEKIARRIRAPANYPITVFIDARGRTAFIHQGPYETEQDLEADVDRYIAA